MTASTVGASILGSTLDAVFIQYCWCCIPKIIGTSYTSNLPQIDIASSSAGDIKNPDPHRDRTGRPRASTKMRGPPEGTQRGPKGNRSTESNKWNLMLQRNVLCLLLYSTGNSLGIHSRCPRSVGLQTLAKLSLKAQMRGREEGLTMHRSSWSGRRSGKCGFKKRQQFTQKFEVSSQSNHSIVHIAT